MERRRPRQGWRAASEYLDFVSDVVGAARDRGKASWTSVPVSGEEMLRSAPLRSEIPYTTASPSLVFPAGTRREERFDGALHYLLAHPVAIVSYRQRDDLLSGRRDVDLSAVWRGVASVRAEVQDLLQLPTIEEDMQSETILEKAAGSFPPWSR